MAAVPSSPIQVGDVVAGKFRVERFVGEGAMGLVVEATHLQLDERVALKFLRAEALGHPEVTARFAQEARAAAKLKSEHVARVLDVGEHGGLPYMVLELLEGEDLEQLVAARGRLPVQEAVDLVIQACEGLAEAHARGIVHRDVKPANLFLVRREDGWSVLKVLDFGISKLGVSGEGPTMAQGRASIVGSPYYMSPEQIRTPKEVDRRSDVWSLGAVLFELLAGETAFASTRLAPLIDEILERGHKHLSELRPDVPMDLVAVVDRCLAKSPADRYQSAGAVALALVQFTTTKSARVTASRAITITRTSGVEPDLPLPSALPPRPSLGDTFDPPPSSTSSTSKSSSAVRAASPISASELASTLAAPSERESEERPRDVLAPTTPPATNHARTVVLGLVALALVGGVVAIARRPDPAPISTSTSTSTSTATATSPSSAPTPSSSSSNAPPTSAPPPPSAGTTAPSVPPERATTATAAPREAGGRAVSAPASARPPAPRGSQGAGVLEIRRER